LWSFETGGTVRTVPEYGANVAPDDSSVFPFLAPEDIEVVLGRLSDKEIDRALRHRIFPVAWSPHATHYAVAGEAAARVAAGAGMDVRAKANPAECLAALQRVYAQRLAQVSVTGLSDMRPGWSAKVRLTPAQTLWAIGLASACTFFVLLPLPVLQLLCGMVFAAFFMMVIALRLLSAMPLPVAPKLAPPRKFPVYSVLVPLFRETSVLKGLLRALMALDYPPERLDIKLVIEKGDLGMRRALARVPLPPHIEIIVVPPVGPQTKPKALNYALNFVRGDLLTIFDAEDLPHARQLKDAAAAFENADSHLACLQAELRFFNATENWLTRQFAAEYCWLFRRLLPVLAGLRLPVLLGGTSNHFRVGILRKVGAWDAFNVTEDADLGLRLVRSGYQCGYLPSRTLEEANCRLINWLRQRARWLKGWIQTWLVHMRSPRALMRDLGWAGFWTAQVLLLGVIASALFHPFFLGIAIWSLATGAFFPENGNGLVTLATGINLAVLLMGYISAIWAARKALSPAKGWQWTFTLLTMPIYWLLISAAGWMALWQFIWSPFHWNKTDHGISSKQLNSNERPVETVNQP